MRLDNAFNTGLFLILLTLSANVPGRDKNSLEVTHCSGAELDGHIGLYGALEITVTTNKKFTNPFDYGEVQLDARFHSPSGSDFIVSGYYDGGSAEYSGESIFKVRFMPDEPGEWDFKLAWNDRWQESICNFIVTENTNPLVHGHVKQDPRNQEYLIHDDGSPHYWWGGKWFSSSNYGPVDRTNPVTGKVEENTYRLADDEIIAYLDLLKKYGHNGILLKTALFPLNNDRLSWDLEWIRRGEWLVKAAGERGIYVQVNLFDTWSRPVSSTFESTTRGDRQVLNVWEDTGRREKENYLLTVIARFAGFYNVYWELGNEMEHAPNCGKCFVRLANEQYLPWIRRHDPYHLPIGLSENIWKDADVDIGFIHQTDEYPPAGQGRPLIMNELVRGGVPLNLLDRLFGYGKGMYNDTYIRSPTKRLAYRRTFWNMFVRGGSGSSEATWLDIGSKPNAAVLDVMEDQQRLRNFIEALPVNINSMSSSGSVIRSASSRIYSRFIPGQIYVAYIPERTTENRQGDLEIGIEQGSYRYHWYDPSNGAYSKEYILHTTGAVHRLASPDNVHDVVLVIRRDSGKQKSSDTR